MKNIFSKLKNPKVLRTLTILFVVTATAFGYYFFSIREGRVFIDDSLMQSPIVAIAPQSGGVLTELDVYEGQHVKKGDSLAIVAGQTLYANTNGLVVMANNQIGSTVAPGTPVVQMINPTDARIAGTIDENKGLSDIHIGQVVSFTVDAFPGRTYWGYVDEISPSAKQTQIAFSISSERPTQQFVVYARYDANKYSEIKNGMSAKMTIYTNTN